MTDKKSTNQSPPPPPPPRQGERGNFNQGGATKTTDWIKPERPPSKK